MRRSELIRRLRKIGAIQFGNFKLKSGAESSVYIDLRLIISHLDLLHAVVDEMAERIDQSRVDLLCGVPYTALPIATALSMKTSIPMVMRRKEAKDYGRKRMLEGEYKPGQRCLIVEDLITSGSSILETKELLESEGLEVTDAIFLIDRQQGGAENLRAAGCTPHSIFTLDEVFTKEETNPPSLNYGDRAKRATNPSGRALLELMEEKESNLSFNPDVTEAAELLRLADLIGPEICMLKTHIDILRDFDQSVAEELQALAKKHNFLIFEDRKFADIGSTVQKQYRDGVYQMSDWADITNAHILPGPGIVEALSQVGLPKGRGLLLLAEMSSKGNLATGDYTRQAVKMAAKYRDFVVGFVAMRRLTDDPAMIHLTPGVQLQSGHDELGQQFKTPHSVIAEAGSDIIQVGRGIYSDKEPLAQAKKYRTAGWEAHKARC